MPWDWDDCKRGHSALDLTGPAVSLEALRGREPAAAPRDRRACRQDLPARVLAPQVSHLRLAESYSRASHQQQASQAAVVLALQPAREPD